MAGYGVRSFLIAQSFNQISKVYGENNAILDNCHVRIAFASNDERTAKRISDSLGSATEFRAQRNYAGHRLAPWLAHANDGPNRTLLDAATPATRDKLVVIQRNLYHTYLSGNAFDKTIAAKRMALMTFREG